MLKLILNSSVLYFRMFSWAYRQLCCGQSLKYKRKKAQSNSFIHCLTLQNLSQIGQSPKIVSRFILKRFKTLQLNIFQLVKWAAYSYFTVNYQERVWLLIITGPSCRYSVSGQMKWWCFLPKTSGCGKYSQPPPGVFSDMSGSRVSLWCCCCLSGGGSVRQTVCSYKAVGCGKQPEDG